jgi:hypothetical protein
MGMFNNVVNTLKQTGKKVSNFVGDEENNISSTVNAKKKQLLFKMLQKKAPETLVKPVASQFDTDVNYQKAPTKFNQNGNWATPDPKLPFYKKILYSNKQ